MADHLSLPPADKLREIAARQDAAEREILARRKAAQKDARSGDQDEKKHSRDAAAQVIQRNYRGYRERRELKGHGLSPSVRWTVVRFFFLRLALAGWW